MNATKAQGCNGYFLGSIPKPTPLTNPATVLVSTTFWGSLNPTGEEWEQQNAYALGMITLNVKKLLDKGSKWMELLQKHGNHSQMSRTLPQAWDYLPLTITFVLYAILMALTLQCISLQ